MNSIVRFATLADVEDLAAIHSKAFLESDNWGRDVFDVHLRLPNTFALICPGVGMTLVRMVADEAEILTLAVIQEAQRRGVGSLLLDGATTALADRKVRALFLEVSARNDAAQALYRRAGFQQVGQRPHYYSDGSDALVLRLTIDPQ